MHIVAEEMDYEQPGITSAHEDLRAALKAAEARVATYMDPWDVQTALQDPKLAPDMGHALRAVASWRVYDSRTITVYEVVLTP